MIVQRSKISESRLLFAVKVVGDFVPWSGWLRREDTGTLPRRPGPGAIEVQVDVSEAGGWRVDRRFDVQGEFR